MVIDDQCINAISPNCPVDPFLNVPLVQCLDFPGKLEDHDLYKRNQGI